MKNLSTEGLCFNAPTAVKHLRGGRPRIPQKASKLEIIFGAGDGTVNQSWEKLFTVAIGLFLILDFLILDLANGKEFYD
jgi:hypothetical protein